MNVKDYIRKVNYHETDKMGITHHSNYIKWMEEARFDYLEQLNCGYEKLERQGIISPVTAVECKYRQPTTFADVISIHTEVEQFKGVKLKIKYTMTNVHTGKIVFTGTTDHCFIDENGTPIILKKQFREFDKIIKEQLKKPKEQLKKPKCIDK